MAFEWQATHSLLPYPSPRKRESVLSGTMFLLSSATNVLGIRVAMRSWVSVTWVTLFLGCLVS